MPALLRPVSRLSREALFRGFAAATAAAAYLLIVLGGAVKAYGAGLACPDWPLCYGQVVPPMSVPVLLEWGHRLGATIVGLLAAASTWVGWRAHSGAVRRGLLAALALLGLQIILGGVTVFMQNSAPATGAHLGVAMAFPAIWAGLAAWRPVVRAGTRPAQSASFHCLATITTAAAWAVMVAGSYLKSLPRLAFMLWPDGAPLL